LQTTTFVELVREKRGIKCLKKIVGGKKKRSRRVVTTTFWGICQIRLAKNAQTGDTRSPPMAINAQGAWSADEGGAVFILTDGLTVANGNSIQLESLNVIQALELVESILLAAKQALNWELTGGEG